MMVEDISILKREDRIHKLVLSAALKQSIMAQYQSTENGLTDSEIYDIMSKIEHRIYYITESPNFEFAETNSRHIPKNGKHVKCDTMIFKLDDFLKATKDKYFIFYNIWSQVDANTNHKIILIRGSFQEDPAAIREIKRNGTLDEK